VSEEAIRELEGRLARYPADRYPVQHGTAAFHLGVVLVDAGRHEEGELALARAAELLDPDGLPVEHATALNARGAALRLLGRHEEAAAAFTQASRGFAAAERPLERGAAEFNLGLVQRELGVPDDALTALGRARELLDPTAAPAQACAAAREEAATLLTLGRLGDAAAVAGEAEELAVRAGDEAGRGASANVRGLALLGLEQPEDAAAAFRDAAAASPRSVRPDGYAMAKANLALALERAGDAPRGRLAARQALGVAGGPPPVREQARAVLERLGDRPGDLLRVLDDEPRDAWPAVLREEVARWADAAEAERDGELEQWVGGLLARPAAVDDLAEAWLGVVLELPPQAMDAVLAAALRALEPHPPREHARFRATVERASARFHVPQLLRLRDTFARLAHGLGVEDAWS
jgi:tetratricopeptide (TPR) repeat protein